ncbi:uncharacterized protein LOC132629131 [Lycium barbarum]|uniref:uncharacterized protein LOC132629131 n=1 Tax=Lycium barbarum TaxID=112863 RepID=UPI00293F4E6D|nr:uncharacterized protein LOC132629131 [Lycium barbarum]
MHPMVGEVGELSEIFQWKVEVPRGLPDWVEKEKQHLDICGIDLGNAALRKLELNAIKYPVSLSKGSSKKHTVLNKTTTTTSTNDSENDVADDGT